MPRFWNPKVAPRGTRWARAAGSGPTAANPARASAPSHLAGADIALSPADQEGEGGHGLSGMNVGAGVRGGRRGAAEVRPDAGAGGSREPPAPSRLAGFTRPRSGKVISLPAARGPCR